MNTYCSESIKKYLEQSRAEKYSYKEVDAIAPIINLKKLYDDFDNLCNTWRFELQKEFSEEKHPKKMVKRAIRKLNSWMVTNAAQQQTKFNLSVVHLMEDILRELSYYDKKMSSQNEYPLLFVCLDPICPQSNLQEMLAAFQYYSLHYNNNAHMLFVNGEIEDYLYFDYLQRTVYEFQMRNVQFLITTNQSVIEEYMRKAFLQISFNESRNSFNNNLKLLRFSTVETEYQDYEIIFDMLDLEEIAKILRGIEMAYEEDTCD